MRNKSTFLDVSKARSLTAVFLLAAGLLCNSAQATPVDFTFTGTGVNGSTATGGFTLDDSVLYPGYVALSNISTNLTLTISNIPQGGLSGPASVTFDGLDLGFTWFQVESPGVVYIAPYGANNYGPPFQDWYGLNQPSQPGFPGSFVFQTELSYDGWGNVKDTITWSAATIVGESSVPDTASTAGLIAIALAGLGVIRRRAARLTNEDARS